MILKGSSDEYLHSIKRSLLFKSALNGNMKAWIFNDDNDDMECWQINKDENLISKKEIKISSSCSSDKNSHTWVTISHDEVRAKGKKC